MSTENGSTNSESPLQSALSQVRNRERSETSKAGHSILQRADFSNAKYGSRKLWDREREIIRLVADGLRNKEIALAIGTTEHVIKNYLRGIYDKLGFSNRIELALWYIKQSEE